MKLHLITIGQPKLIYAQQGWKEYYPRLSHYHQLRTSRILDKHDDAAHILAAAGNSYVIALAIDGRQFSSPDLAVFLDKRALEGREVSLMIGGPEGLPGEVLAAADLRWSLSALTLPHDLAMVVVLEALYRASTISGGTPYHK